MLARDIPSSPDSERRNALSSWLGPILYMWLVGLYFVVRYSYQWAENDSAIFTHHIRTMIQEGRLTPLHADAYPNGFAYQAISTAIVAMTGLDVTLLQQLVYPLLAALVVLPAWILYREITGSAKGATLATLLLFTQPEFLFVVLRSSHEKFTRAFMMLCLFLLLRSFKLHDRPRAFATHVGLFYLIAFAFVASNNLMTHTFVFAIACAMLFAWLLGRRSAAAALQSHSISIMRFVYPILIILGLVYVFTFYLYPPARHDLLILKDSWQRVQALLFEPRAADTAAYTGAYAYISFGWVNLPTYFLVSIANWIMLIASLAIWIRQVARWLLRDRPPQSRSTWMLWLLYAAFAAQGILSVVADASGALGSNLQHRLFPSFTIIAVGIVAMALENWRPRRFAAFARPALAVGLCGIAALSALKATNEPALSNKWVFYRPAEIAALRWTDQHTRNATIGTEFDERLRVAFVTMFDKSEHGNIFRTYTTPAVSRDLILTAVTRLRSSRLQAPLPIPPDALRVYDNGEGELYHLRPQTPYQH